jgi:signal transduction histidine kinase
VLDAQHVELLVRDDGRGIAAAHLPHVFEPFFTTRMGRGGTGLGLHISFNIVTAVLGGKICVESVPGQGTTVRLSMPRVVERRHGLHE